MNRFLCGWVALGLVVAVVASILAQQRLEDAKKKEQARADCKSWQSP